MTRENTPPDYEVPWGEQGNLDPLEFKPKNYVIEFREDVPPRSITFHGPQNEEVGRLDFNTGAMVFTGQAEESAVVFLSVFMRLANDRMAIERRRQRDADIALIEKQVGNANMKFFSDLLKSQVI